MDNSRESEKFEFHIFNPYIFNMLDCRNLRYELCSRFSPKPEFLIDSIACKHGHSILRTPPYHPELQPIEICWAVVKNHVALHNDFTMKKVWMLLEEGFEKITAETCQEFIKKVRQQEDDFWAEDMNQ